MDDRRMVWALGLALTALAAFTASGQDEQGKDAKAAPRGPGTAASPEALEKALTGDLAFTGEQKPKVKAAWEKSVPPALAKLAAASNEGGDAKAAREEVTAALDAYKAALSKILTEEQYKKVEAILASRSARRGGDPRLGPKGAEGAK